MRLRNEERPFTIGWIGSPTTAGYLKSMLPVLRDLQERFNIQVVIVGAHNNGVLKHELFEFRPWTEETEVSSIQTFDVGIMPLPDTPWARGKCGYKLIQYMACGVPVVASKIGANQDIINSGQQGFLCSTLREWHEALTKLYLSRDLCMKMAHEGRKRVEEKYHLGITAPILAKYLTQATVCMR
jgi:glycosyltransferase involved in cell wall biosynthesis